MTTIEFTSHLNQVNAFLNNFALRLTRNSEKAKDLLQDTALRAYRYKEKFNDGTNFRGWTATIMRNIFVTQYKREKRFLMVSEPIESFAYELESKVIMPNAGEVNLKMEEFTKMFGNIGAIYSTPFLLHFDGYEYQEIAEHLDIPIGTVKSRIYTARQKLKEMLSTEA